METRGRHLIGIQGKVASLTIGDRGQRIFILLNLWPDSGKRLLKKREVTDVEELIRLLQKVAAQVREMERSAQALTE